MSFYVIVCTLIVGSTLPAFAEQPSVPLSDVRIDTTSLQKWGLRTYSMTRTANQSGQPVTQRVGRMSFSCEVKEGSINLTINTRMFMQGGKRFIEFQADCHYPKMNLLSPPNIKIEAVRSDGVKLKETRATVHGETLEIVDVARGRSSTTESEWPEDGVIDVAVFYLVTLLPREPNRRYAIGNYLSSSSLRKPGTRVIECVGPDMSTGERDKHWLEFRSYEPNHRSDAIRYWVSDDGLLRRVQLNKENRLELEVDKQEHRKREKD